MLPFIGAGLGTVGGFMLGLAVLAYITKDMRKKELVEDKDKKIWLGLLGWFFAIVGGWLGWQIGGYIAYAYR